MTVDCCQIDLRVSGSTLIPLTVAASEIALTVAASDISLTAVASEIALEAAASEIALELGAMGPQGPPGSSAGSAPSFASTNKHGSSIVAGAPVATHSTGVGIVLADATTSAKPSVGLNMATAADLAAVTVQTSGPFELTDWTAITGTAELAAKAVYFLSTTAGKLTTTSPTDNPAISQRVGKAISPTILDIDPFGFIQL